MKPTVYVETSVVSYLTARPSRDVVVLANQQLTKEWWLHAVDRFNLVASELVIDEAAAGDPGAARERLATLKAMAVVQASDEAKRLARLLLSRGAVPPNASDDATHIALAATSGAEYLVTWNLRHIANAAMRSRIEQACRHAGYAPPIICTPSELMEN